MLLCFYGFLFRNPSDLVFFFFFSNQIKHPPYQSQHCFPKTGHFLAQLSRTTFSLNEIRQFSLISVDFFSNYARFPNYHPNGPEIPKFSFFLLKNHGFGIPRPLGIGGPFSTPANPRRLIGLCAGPYQRYINLASATSFLQRFLLQNCHNA